MLFRVIALVSVGVVAGFVLGGVGPQRELSKVSSELALLKRRIDRLDRPNPLRELLPGLVARGEPNRKGRELARQTPLPARNQGAAGNGPDGHPRTADTGSSGAVIIRGSEDDGLRARAAPRADEDTQLAQADAQQAEDQGSTSRRQRSGFGQLNLARFDELSAAQAMRFAASRAALIEQAGLNEKETAAVDSTVKKMNDDLSGYGEEILSQASSEEPPSPSQALGLGHDVSGIMYDGQKQLEGIVGKRAEGVEPGALEIWNYVDMARLRPAAEKYLPGAGPAADTQGTAPSTAVPAPSNPDTQDEE